MTQAAQPALDRLRARIAVVLETEAELRALATALFEAGNRDDANANGARLAAEHLRHAIHTARQAASMSIDLGPARRLIERLRTDSTVSL